MASEIETRPIGAEDIAFDETGNEATGTFTDYNGTEHTYQKLNAKHLPITGTLRARFTNAANVEKALDELKTNVESISASGYMTADTTVALASGASVTAWQSAIDAIFKNLGGHKLTIQFPYGVTSLIGAALVVKDFYDGTVEIDLNDGTLGDSIQLSHVLQIKNCHCSVKVTNGNIQHTLSTPYGVSVETSASVVFDGIVFTGFSATTGSYGIHFYGSCGMVTDCTVSTDQLFYVDSVEKAGVDSKISAHNSASDAHSALFGAKAPLVSPHFTGTPDIAIDGNTTSPVATAKDIATHDGGTASHADIRATVNAHSVSINTLSATVDAHSVSINTLSSTVDAHSVSINSLSLTVTAQGNSITSLSATVDGHTTWLTTMAAAVNNLISSFASLSSMVTALGGSVSIKQGRPNWTDQTKVSLAAGTATVNKDGWLFVWLGRVGDITRSVVLQSGTYNYLISSTYDDGNWETRDAGKIIPVNSGDIIMWTNDSTPPNYGTVQTDASDNIVQVYLVGTK